MIYLNGQPVNVTIFPDNTSQVWHIPNLLDIKVAELTWRFSSEAEIMHLAQLKDLLDHYEIPANLKIEYLPYGRQDKEISNETTFALHSFAKILNRMEFDYVDIVDPHSHVALNLINDSQEMYPVSRVFKVAIETESDIMCFPDKGALEKYSVEYNNLYMPYIFGQKVRDQATGNITHYQLVGECYGKNVLIVDDICDGGMTFKLLAKELLAAGAKSVVLFVSHGIFSKGTRTLFESGISRVFTQDGEVGPRETSIQF
jgi:ribose-phosphate pyrophosphokinase